MSSSLECLYGCTDWYNSLPRWCHWWCLRPWFFLHSSSTQEGWHILRTSLWTPLIRRNFSNNLEAIRSHLQRNLHLLLLTNMLCNHSSCFNLFNKRKPPAQTGLDKRLKSSMSICPQTTYIPTNLLQETNHLGGVPDASPGTQDYSDILQPPLDMTLPALVTSTSNIPQEMGYTLLRLLGDIDPTSWLLGDLPLTTSLLECLDSEEHKAII